MNNVTFKVFRFNPDNDKKHYFDTFSIPFTKGMTVLDGLFYIQRRMDGSLAFRVSCRAGVCGSCSMHINGKYRLACETQVGLLGGNITVRPLSHLPIFKDLFVDFKPFWDKYKYIKPYLIPGNTADETERLQTQDDRKKIDLIIDCILCSSCYSSCTMTATHKDYLGPAALLKVNRFVQDTRDNATTERLDVASGNDGVFRCHTIYNCQYVCPKDLDPTGAIANLKRKIVAKDFGCKK